MIVGICEHGEILSAFAEEHVSHEWIEESVLAYTLKRVDNFTFGDCPMCKLRIDNNIAIINETREFVL